MRAAALQRRPIATLRRVGNCNCSPKLCRAIGRTGDYRQSCASIGFDRRVHLCLCVTALQVYRTVMSTDGIFGERVEIEAVAAYMRHAVGWAVVARCSERGGAGWTVQ